MLEMIDGYNVYLNNTLLQKIHRNTILKVDNKQTTAVIDDLCGELINSAIIDKSDTTYKFYFNYSTLKNFNNITNIPNNRYVWTGLIKTQTSKSFSEAPFNSLLSYYSNYELTTNDIDFLLSKWDQQYINSDYIKNKNVHIKRHFLASLGRFENYKDHFVFKKNGTIIANLSVKYFFYPIAQSECSAIHMWVDQLHLTRDEKLFIHYTFAKEIDRINEITQMFCGISYENRKAINAALHYGFTPYFIESKIYE